MASEKKSGSVKRFGARYGRKVKDKVAKIDSLKKTRYKCPYCHNRATQRLAAGIFTCKKCNSKFTGKAYSVEDKGKKRLVSEEAMTLTIEEKAPEETTKEELLEDEDFEAENRRLLKEAEAEPESEYSQELENTEEVNEDSVSNDKPKED